MIERKLRILEQGGWERPKPGESQTALALNWVEGYRFRVDLILIVPCVAVLVLVWYPLLALLMRPWIHLPLFPFGKRPGRLTTLRELGPRIYVLTVGVLQWGWPCFAGITLSDYLSERYWGRSLEKLSALGLVVSFLIWSAAGVGFGYTMWERSAPRNDDEMTVRR